jgi:hypothetical protein
MAIGTIGGKVGYIVGPIVAVPALFISADWFGFSLDSGPRYAVAAWLLFGLAVAVVAGLGLRWVLNRCFGVESAGI